MRIGRSLSLVFGVTALVLLAGVGGYVFLHRVEIFELRPAWREVLKLWNAERRDEAFPQAVSRLLQIQLPGETFRLTRFTFERMRSRDGHSMYLLRIMDGDRCLLLDAGGFLVRTEDVDFQPAGLLERYWIAQLRSGNHDMLQRSTDGQSALRYSVDSRGFVPHGWVFLDDHDTPIRGKFSGFSAPPERDGGRGPLV